MQGGTPRSETLDLKMGPVPKQMLNKRKHRDSLVLLMKDQLSDGFGKLWKV